jgi:uroporphyrin-III C-methyltransferase/precorrin-2 dehydrogenase/sirohydrochlorin ferrochelatase
MTSRRADTAYPVMLDLSGRRALVVGGGPVAARRGASLAESGARVCVVTPWACEAMWALVDQGLATITLREFEDSDINGAWFVHTATGDRAVDAAVVAACESARIWCVRADDASASRAWTPAVLRRGDVTIAVTSGADPKRSVALRNAIGRTLDTGGLPLRRRRTSQNSPGWVALVGGGPGDPGLITARGLTLLAAADVVVVDRLAPRALLERLDDGVEVVEAGKGPDAHTMTQQEINALLVERASAGKRVVRLKGGDPFVLGRGGEEVLACREAGVEVECVPGVTSAVAAAAAGGVPVTHRGLSSQFSVISAHDDDVDATFADAPSNGTLVILMGVARLDRIADALVTRGRSPRTPVTIIERGTLPDQRVTVATLGTAACIAADAGVRSPAVIVVGEVCSLTETIGGTLNTVTV